MDKLRQMIAQDKDETVPEGLDMTLEEWQWLKAAYIECPECLALSGWVFARMSLSFVAYFSVALFGRRAWKEGHKN